jgi:hypothetical protein
MEPRPECRSAEVQAKPSRGPKESAAQPPVAQARIRYAVPEKQRSFFLRPAPLAARTFTATYRQREDPSVAREPKPLEQFSRTPVAPEEVAAVFEEVRKANDRHAAVHLGAFVEQGLGIAFLSLVGEQKSAELKKEISWASFDDKIKAALKLELIDDRIFKKLEIIRQIRNAFAHSARPISFETPEVVAAVDELIDDGKAVPTNMLDNASPARAKFSSCCRAVMATVGFRAIGRKFHLMGRVVEALSTAQAKPELMPFAETIKQSAEKLKKFEM